MEVLSLLSDDVETDNAGPGENLKLRLKGIEEEEILPGFILCNAENLCHSGRIFDAQVSIVLYMWVKSLKSVPFTPLQPGWYWHFLISVCLICNILMHYVFLEIRVKTKTQFSFVFGLVSSSFNNEFFFFFDVINE